MIHESAIGAAAPDRVVVINDHSTANGGTAALALLSIRLLRARGIPVTLICGDTGDAGDLRDLGVEIHALGNRDLLERPKREALRRGVFDRAACDLVARVRDLREGPGTVFHVHGWAQILSPSIFRALAPVARRTFLHAHDTFLACPNGMYMDYQRHEVCHRVPLSASCLATHCDKRSYAQKLWRVSRHAMLFRCLDRRALWAGLLTIHPDVAPKFTRAGYPEALLRVVRNPATPYAAERIAAERNRALVYVGRLERDKGVMDLAAAAERCGVPLRLIGDGALKGEIAERYPSVDLLGWQAPDRIGALVAEARGLVMPSHHPEPFALVIPEAVQSGLPVLVAETALLAPEIAARGFGRTFDVFDPASFDAAVGWLRDLPDPELTAMSRRCHSEGPVLSSTPESWVDQLVSLYAGALATT